MKTYAHIGSYVILALMLSCSAGTVIREGTREPGRTDEEDHRMIQEGIESYDRGEYRQAVEIYQKALEKNPENVVAMYELALTYTGMKEYQKSYDLCMKIMSYKTDIVRQAYMIAGTDLDELGRPKDAIMYYKAGIKKYPDDLMLHFNLAVTQVRQGAHEEAKQSLKTALFIRPTHPSSHLVLAGVLWQEGNRIPALLAYTRFLMLEPNSKRSAGAREKIKAIINHGVSKDQTKANQINVSFDPNEPQNEGDFSVISLMLSLKSAQQFTGDKEFKSEKDAMIDTYESVFSMMGESGQKDKAGFIWEYYAPFFVALKEKGHVPALVDGLFQYHTENTDALYQWAGEYRWPSKLK